MKLYPEFGVGIASITVLIKNFIFIKSIAFKEIAYQIFLDEDGFEKLRIRFNTDKGKILDVVVQYESFVNGKFVPIIRYDCAHGFFHRDVLYPGGEKEKQTINLTNLEDALNYAEQDLKDRWEFYKERYLKKLKL